MYPEASNFVGGVDTAFMVIFGISIFFLITITIVMLSFVVKYRRSKHPKAVQVKEKMWLEASWIAAPMVIVIFMFYYGYIAYKPQREPPKDAMQVKAIAKMWDWTFEYSNGKQSPELVVPIKKAVNLNLISLDVIHSLYIPAFRIKEDLIPGKKGFMWFIGEEYGSFDIFCAEFCGLRHSFMESKVKVVTEEEFTKFLSALPEKKFESEGLAIIKKNACTGCHSLDGKKGVSTTFKGLFGSIRSVSTDGTERDITADEFYIRQSILKPSSDVVKGYADGVMKSYRGIVSNDEIKKIIEYLKTLK